MAEPKPTGLSGVHRLLHAMEDVVKAFPPRAHPPRGQRGSRRHEDLFIRYAEDLRKAKQGADAWWEALIDTEEERTGDRQQAIERVTERRPVGPVAEPMVIATLRKYWLACVALNESLPWAEQVAPEEFVLRWLLQRDCQQLASFLAALPYWPMGLSPQGTWT